MAEVVGCLTDTYLLREPLPWPGKCAGKDCLAHPPTQLYIYWYSEEQGTAAPAGMPQVCSQECWESLQDGPKPIGRPRGWAERFPPGQYPA